MSNPEVEHVLNQLGIDAASDGTVELCHATLAGSADSICQTGDMHVSEDGVFFCTSPQIIGQTAPIFRQPLPKAIVSLATSGLPFYSDNALGALFAPIRVGLGR